jgi:hypothetical protein
MHNIMKETITRSISPLSNILIEQEPDSQQLGMGVGGSKSIYEADFIKEPLSCC